MAYSGSPVTISNSGHVDLQHLTPSASFPTLAPNGSLIAHYAKESSKQLAAGIVTLGGIGYKKLARYYSDLSPDGNCSQSGTTCVKMSGTANGHLPGADNVRMVIVRDIVSKALIVQFRAHKSPISGLCFDPSSTLLVTASVQGHNINVFQIMPILSENTSPSPGSSFVHLYRLLRGLTNAVIQDISFSADSHWIMITSSRGTSHLFTISPSAEAVNFRSSDAYLTVTLSAVGRIRSGSNGWRNTVTGAAAAATGRTISFSGSIASAFHHCNNTSRYADSGLLKANYRLLVFSSPHCMMQYALRICSEVGSVTTIPAVGSTETGLETRLVVEAIQKWNIFQKQSYKEQDDNADIYGELGCSGRSKVVPEGITEGNSRCSTREKIRSKEGHQIFISEAELQMHIPQNQLWAKSEVFFQSFVMDGIYVDDGCGGEAEIEVIPTYMVGATSKHSIPVFNHLQASKTEKARVRVHSNNGQQLCAKPEVSESTKLKLNSGRGSSHSMDKSGVELHHGRETKRESVGSMSQTSSPFVNSSDSRETATSLDFVNNVRSSMEETQSKFVSTNLGVTKTVSHLEDEAG